MAGESFDLTGFEKPATAPVLEGGAALASPQAQIVVLERKLIQKTRELAELRSLAEYLHVERDKACSDLTSARSLLHRLKAGVRARDLALAESARNTGWVRAERHLATEHAGALMTALADARSQIDRIAAELERHATELAAMRDSTSWRFSGPFRSWVGQHPGAHVAFRLLTRLTWWATAPRAPARPGTAPSRPAPAGTVQNVADVARDERVLAIDLAKAELAEFLEAGDRLTAIMPPSPDISVVVVLWNQAHFTLRCLRAVLAQLGPTAEIILVDNASTDETGALLSRLDGIQVLRSPTNEGFVAGCNLGAATARGRTLLMLNSDAFLRPGALAAALATLDAAPDIGAVGARLVLPSGRLQEAGCIVWSDASTQGYGRGLPEDAGEAMFRRDVDYCSGAFLLTPAALWTRLGGFCDAYRPGYYEETDYCMRLREQGYRVVYEPAAIVDHIEAGSEARRGDAAATTIRNRKTFRLRHAATLQQRHIRPCPENLLPARARLAAAQRRLLILDNEVPLQGLGSGFPRAGALLREAVAAGWAVTFFPLHQLTVDWDEVRAEIPWEVEIPTNWAVPRLTEFLEQRHGYYDTILVSRPDNMRILRDLLRARPDLFDGVWLIYDAEALFAARDAIRAGMEGAPLPRATIDARIATEISLADPADAIICVNEAEAALFRRHQACPVHVIGHSTVPQLAAPGFAGRGGFLFVGRLLEQDSPNWRGLAWFIRDCWPLIRATLPGATLSVAGRLHPDHAALEAPGVRLLGAVDNLQPLYDAARMFLAPIQFAAGIPIKVIDAMAAGLPTAGTRLMARQLGLTSGVEIVTEDHAAPLATAICALYEDEAAWTAMRRAALTAVARDHDAAHFRERLRRVLGGQAPIRADRSAPA